MPVELMRMVCFYVYVELQIKFINSRSHDTATTRNGSFRTNQTCLSWAGESWGWDYSKTTLLPWVRRPDSTRGIVYLSVTVYTGITLEPQVAECVHVYFLQHMHVGNHRREWRNTGTRALLPHSWAHCGKTVLLIKLWVHFVIAFTLLLTV